MSAAIPSGEGTEVYQCSQSRPSDAAATSASWCSSPSGSSVTTSPVSRIGSRNAISAVAQRAQRRLAGLAGEPVEEDLAVEVIDLMLQASGHQSLALQPQGLAVDVEALGDDVHRAHGGRPDAGHRETPLVAVLALLRPLD